MGRYIDEFNLNASGIENFNFVATDGQTTYTLPTPGVPIIFIGGAIQVENVDFTLADQVVTFTTPLVLNDAVVGYVLEKGKSIDPSVTYSIETFSGDNSTTAFTSAYSISSGSALVINVSGVVLNHISDYNTTGGTTINFVVAPATGTDNIHVLHLGATLQVNVPAAATVGHDTLTVDFQIGVYRKNYFINPQFEFWQRAASQTTDGYASDDRWYNALQGPGVRTHSRQAFATDQIDVPGFPAYYSRTLITDSGGTAGSFVAKYQRIENVRQLAGKTATLSFWAKSDVARDISTRFHQVYDFTPLDTVTSDVKTHSLTTVWQKFTHTATFNNIPGSQIIVTDENCTQVDFWYSAGSDSDAETNSLGNQTGTFDVARAQLEDGSVATEYEYRTLMDEIFLCQRYYEKSYTVNVDPGTATLDDDSYSLQRASLIGLFAGTSPLIPKLVPKRITPTLVIYALNGTAGNVTVNNSLNSAGFLTSVANTNSFRIWNNTALTNIGDYFSFMWATDAEL